MPFTYSPPGNVADFDAGMLTQWDQTVSDIFSDAIKQLRQTLGAEPQFYSEKDRPTRPGAQVAPIPWNGYPRRVILVNPGRYTDAEHLAEFNRADPTGFSYLLFEDPNGQVPITGVYYRPQDEYLEWFVQRDAQNRILKITFTAEPPDYYSAWYAYSEKDATEAIAEMSNTSKLTPDDVRCKTDLYYDVGTKYLFANRGDYHPNNVAVTKNGIVHLTHQSNTLGAEITLAAIATPPYGVEGKPITDEQRLVCCAGFGEPSRSSDPTIGFTANQKALTGAHVTLTDPVGLYIGEMDTTHITDANGGATDPNWFKVVRGDGPPGQNARIVRAEYAVPGGFVSDLLIDGDKSTPITAGGQLAALITMHLFATVDGTDAPRPRLQKCGHFCCRNAQSIYEVKEVGDPACGGAFAIDPYPGDHDGMDVQKPMMLAAEVPARSTLRWRARAHW